MARGNGQHSCAAAVNKLAVGPPAVTSHHHSALTAAEARARRPRHRRNRHLQLAAHAYTAARRVCVDVMEEKNYF